MANDLIASMVLAIWLYLIAARGGFWRAADRDDAPLPAAAAPAAAWPAVTAVIPARDEAECVGETVASLLRQDYPGAFTVVLVDDQSRDGTAQVARDAAVALGAADRLTVLPGRPLPAGLDRQALGAAAGRRTCRRAPRRRLSPPHRRRHRLCAGRADAAWWRGRSAAGLVLTSLMAKLRCKSFAERMFVPAFIFFFQMLYPFAWANNPRRGTAAAAGGCMLVRREALRDAGGLAAIRDALIDDCTLAKLLKTPRPDLDHADRARAQHPRLSGHRRYPPHGVAHRLCAIALFAAAARRHRFRSGADLSGAGGACDLRATACRNSSASSSGC